MHWLCTIRVSGSFSVRNRKAISRRNKKWVRGSLTGSLNTQAISRDGKKEITIGNALFTQINRFELYYLVWMFTNKHVARTNLVWTCPWQGSFELGTFWFLPKLKAAWKTAWRCWKTTSTTKACLRKPVALQESASGICRSKSRSSLPSTLCSSPSSKSARSSCSCRRICSTIRRKSQPRSTSSAHIAETQLYSRRCGEWSERAHCFRIICKESYSPSKISLQIQFATWIPPDKPCTQPLCSSSPSRPWSPRASLSSA